MRRKNLGFTLAEVLIVIGIIGVVAALTLPNLNHATGDKEKVTKVKKIYSALTEAFDRAQAIYGNADTWFNDLNCDDDRASCAERLEKRITEFLKVSKDCKFSDGCWADAPCLFSDGSEGFENYLNDFQAEKVYMVTLSDGMSLGFDYQQLHIRVDIDGPNKGKNQYGNDIFDFAFCTYSTESTCNGASANQLYPSARPFSWTGDLIGEGYSGNYAAAWVIENGNLDYLKRDDEGLCPDGQPLNWETKTSCE